MKRYLNLLLDGLEAKNFKSVFCLYSFAVLLIVPATVSVRYFFGEKIIPNFIFISAWICVAVLFILHYFLRERKGISKI